MNRRQTLFVLDRVQLWVLSPFVGSVSWSGHVWRRLKVSGAVRFQSKPKGLILKNQNLTIIQYKPESFNLNPKGFNLNLKGFNLELKGNLNLTCWNLNAKSFNQNQKGVSWNQKSQSHVWRTNTEVKIPPMVHNRQMWETGWARGAHTHEARDHRGWR